MKILICHERFLFRFGADRTLILLGKGLTEQGHQVTLMANRFDADVVNYLFSRIITCPSDEGPYLELNEYTTDWLRTNWSQLFAAGDAPDAVIVGGWPFFSAITFFREVCPHVIFIDFGVVPSYGYSEGVQITLNKLRALRTSHLPNASLIVSISRFIMESQSRPDAANAVPTKTVLLGADHMEMSVWRAAQVGSDAAQRTSLEMLRALKAEGKKLILCLGRWEPRCYKNSQAVFDIASALVKGRANIAILVLDKPENLEIPRELADVVRPVGFPDDNELLDIMKEADLGLSTSLWEGFNLPLAEMQWLGRPALVFNEGAHPEVVAHPWFLCRDPEEMAAKAIELLSDRGPDKSTVTRSIDKFREFFRWGRFMEEYADILRDLSQTPTGELLLLVDVSNSCRDTANSGVVRVTRRLCRELQRNGESPIFVIWDEQAGRYVFPTDSEYDLLGGFNGPIRPQGNQTSASDHERLFVDGMLRDVPTDQGWLLIPELMLEASFKKVRRFARQWDLRIAAIFYDSIPLLRPDLCNEEVRNNHRSYMLGLAECDLCVPISAFSASCLQDMWRESRVTTDCRVATNVLPGEFGNAPRKTIPTEQSNGKVNILCVSTLEPRKNHRNLIQACLWISEQHPSVDWSLTLVGNRYAGAFEIADWIQDISSKYPRIEWLGVVDDATLDARYQQASFTVYPSVIEGFGLPIVESVWHGRPCICYNRGVMAELAEGGGCHTVDVTDPIKLGEAILQLATNDGLRTKLSRDAEKRSLKTWRDYVVELKEALKTLPRSKRQSEPANSLTKPAPTQTPHWQTVLYPNCLTDNWQMNDSERMALTGLLARQRPNCSIEVGTYCAGSLSLIAQYSKLVFSIDIDDTIPSRFHFPNVSFLTGQSVVILPHLLRELDAAGIPLDFVLIDGDHSANGVMQDVGCLLSYVPRKPFFVLLHDSFNPECRLGMLNAGWDKSPYCHWLDLDFVPGRVVEHEGPSRGQLWGGLAAAFFSPEVRQGPLQTNETTRGMFTLLSEHSLEGRGASL